MKNTFQEYHPIDSELLTKMWCDALFIFDTNVLLNLYRYSEKSSDEFIHTITELNDRVWLPFQVGLEFNRNRLNVLSDQRNNYTNFEKKIQDLIDEIENRNRNPFFSQSLTEKFIEIKEELNIEIENKVKAYESSIKTDPILEKINSAFDCKVGKPFSSDEISQIQKEGEKRYQNRIPPGYCDIKKPEYERYGDLFLWKQIIQKSKESQIDVIFVLDDRKEDWWFEHHSKTISPRPELLKEFRINTEQNIHFYKPFQFLEYSNKYLESQIADDVIEEVKNYKPAVIINENFIQINFTLKGNINDFHSLINEMKNTGYNIFAESNNENNIHFLNITLPNIPDLERRLNAKFIARLSEYNMHLIKNKN